MKSSYSILLEVFFVYAGSLASDAAQLPAPRRHVVEIRDFGFHPKSIQVSAGDTIVWTNRDLVPHTATADDGGWSSPELAEGQSWEWRVAMDGLQNYFCEFHPHMTGSLAIHGPGKTRSVADR